MMEKKLYRVKVVLYVMAENESEARVAATNAHFDIFECTARKATSLDPGWDDAIPYNSGDIRTCAEIISSVQQVVQKDAHPYTSTRKWQPRAQTYAAVQASPG
jgi:hypothetical protein